MFPGSKYFKRITERITIYALLVGVAIDDGEWCEGGFLSALVSTLRLYFWPGSSLDFVSRLSRVPINGQSSNLNTLLHRLLVL